MFYYTLGCILEIALRLRSTQQAITVVQRIFSEMLLPDPHIVVLSV